MKNSVNTLSCFSIIASAAPRGLGTILNHLPLLTELERSLAVNTHSAWVGKCLTEKYAHYRLRLRHSWFCSAETTACPTRKLCCRRETARCRCKFRSMHTVQAVVCFIWYFYRQLTWCRLGMLK